VPRKRRGKTDKERAQTQEKKKKESQKKQNAAKSTFFAPPPSHDAPLPHGENEQEPESEEDMPIFTGVVPDEAIIAELDADNEDNDEDNDEDADFENEPHADTDDSSVMKTYLRATQERLRK